MKKTILFFCIILIGVCLAQLNVQYVINTSLERKPISPYIYGTNGQSNDFDLNISSRRLGGNRLTGYNWENNASNAGSDYFHVSDNWLISSLNIPSRYSDTPGVVLTAFHDTSLKMRAVTFLTLPMAGYVAADKNGTVNILQTAPSNRWCEVINDKNAPFLLKPNVLDNKVYIDECLNFLINKYGKANSDSGIKGYALDNEPDLWTSTHPRIVPERPTISQFINRSVSLATTIKRMDPYADVIGLVSFGWGGFQTFNNAPDWNQYRNKRYTWFIDAYLAEMKKKSDSLKIRLVDVLALHWYPEALGYSHTSGNYERVYNSANPADSGVAKARMQSVRSLYDARYLENSWITNFGSGQPINLLGRVSNSINRYFPGTKIAFTEYNFGGRNHISGGIAQVDVLGIFGKQGVYLANCWDPVIGYARSAFRLFRNYDGNFSCFGDTSVMSTTSDIENSTIYASVNDKDSTTHVIITNKNLRYSLSATITLKSLANPLAAEGWFFDESSTLIKPFKDSIRINGNQLSLTIPKLSALHLVIKNDRTTVLDPVTKELLQNSFIVYPNPVKENLVVGYNVGDNKSAVIQVYEIDGKLCYESPPVSGMGTLNLSFLLAKLVKGNYHVVLKYESGRTLSKKITLF